VVQDVFATAWQALHGCRSTAGPALALRDRAPSSQHSSAAWFRRGRLQHRLEAEPNEATGPTRIANQLDLRLARAVGHLRPKDQEDSG